MAYGGNNVITLAVLLVDPVCALDRLSGNRWPEENAEDSILHLFRGKEDFLESLMPIRARKSLVNVTGDPKKIITRSLEQ